MKTPSLRLVIGIAVLLIACRTKPPEKPVNYERVYDNADVLTVEQEASIIKQMVDLEDKVGSQLAVVILDTLNGREVEEYSLEKAKELKLGRKGINDGILIVVVVRDRKMRIEVGLGLEKIIKDEIASQINAEEMAPRFRTGDFAGGLSRAIGRISQLIKDHQELIGPSPGKK